MRRRGGICFQRHFDFSSSGGQRFKRNPSNFRILVVKQTGQVRSPLNATLVDVVMRSILPTSPQHLSATDVRDAIETHLQTREEDIWIGWTVRTNWRKFQKLCLGFTCSGEFKCYKCGRYLQAGGKAPQEFEKLLLVLMMTLPGSPAVQYNGDVDQTQVTTLSFQDSF